MAAINADVTESLLLAGPQPWVLPSHDDRWVWISVSCATFLGMRTVKAVSAGSSAVKIALSRWLIVVVPVCSAVRVCAGVSSSTPRAHHGQATFLSNRIHVHRSRVCNLRQRRLVVPRMSRDVRRMPHSVITAAPSHSLCKIYLELYEITCV